jgi:hypothetical protein
LYKDRPDFLIIEGSFMVSSDGGISSIFAEYQHGTALAKLREVNGRHPQLTDWEIDLPQLPPPAAIIECSWNKSEAVAARQLERYMELMPPIKPEQTLFVSSATSGANEIQTLSVPRGAGNSELIVSTLANFLKISLAL